MSFEDEVEYFSAYDAGVASQQAEIDELKAKIAMYEREGYKVVPMKATYGMTVAASNHAIKTEPVLNFGDLYSAMINAAD